MKVCFNSKYSTAMCNLVMQVAMTDIPVIRPIAVRVGNSNVLSAGDNVIEDTYEFISNLTALHFVDNTPIGTEKAEVFSTTIHCNGALTAKDVCPPGVFLSDKSNPDAEILHTLEKEEIVIYFLKSTGAMTYQEVVDLLTEQNLYNENVVGINTRFSILDNYTFVKDESFNDGENDQYEITITTSSNYSEETIFSYCAKRIQQQFN